MNHVKPLSAKHDSDRPMFYSRGKPYAAGLTDQKKILCHHSYIIHLTNGLYCIALQCHTNDHFTRKVVKMVMLWLKMRWRGNKRG